MNLPPRIELANIPTPIQTVEYDSTRFYIKRDDLTGLELTGNKVRKLEYLIKDALNNKSDYLITCGGEQSNHARASVISAASAGIKTKLFLWGKEKKNKNGNLFLNTLFADEIFYLNRNQYSRVDEFMTEEALELSAKGYRPYVVPEGGSSEVGIWGYVAFVNEIAPDVKRLRIKGILTAAGSGGTTAGLLVGSAMQKMNLKIFAVNVLYSKAVIREKILELADSTIEKYGLNIAIDEKRLEILDGYSEEGYKHISDEKVMLIRSFANKTGILFDPAYTGKAFFAFHENFLGKMKTSNILFVHTGGFFGVFNKSGQYLNC